jgi:aspartate-semialdehyde dehydrogenase
MLEILDERSFPASHVRALATSRSAGREVPFAGETLVIEETSAESLTGLDLVLLDTPDDPARELAPIARDAGAIVVDNSAAWRMEKDVPLVVPEVNPTAAMDHKGIIANPNCTTIGVVMALFPLQRDFGIDEVVVSSYQAASGAGRAGVEELDEQVTKVAHDLDALAKGLYRGPDPEVFVDPIAFNAIPQVGSIGEEGFTSEEWKLVHEVRKILGVPSLKVAATCVRIPSVVGHGASVRVVLRQEVNLEEVNGVFAEASGLEITEHPTPLRAAGIDNVLIGRIRKDPFDPNAVWFFCSADNLRKGAALNAIQVAELLL